MCAFLRLSVERQTRPMDELLIYVIISHQTVLLQVQVW